MKIHVMDSDGTEDGSQQTSVDLSALPAEKAERFMRMLDEMIHSMEPFDPEQFITDLARARAAWERGERGKGIAARLKELREGE